jgi:hypothetical protein
MSRKFKSLLNLTTLTTDPSGSEGDVFFNTTDKALKIHNGTTWVTISSNTDPTPFYMHTHTYDGDVHSIDIENPVTFQDINSTNNTPSTPLPIIIGMDGGDPSDTLTNPLSQDLDLFDGGTL